MTLTKGAAPAILPGQANRRSFHQERSESQRLPERPVVGAFSLVLIPSPIKKQFFDLRLNRKTFRHPGHPADDQINQFPRNTGFRFLVAVGRLKDRGRIFEAAMEIFLSTSPRRSGPQPRRFRACF